MGHWKSVVEPFNALGFLDAHIMTQRSPHAVAGPFASGGLVSRYI